jgi:hypothetical protein
MDYNPKTDLGKLVKMSLGHLPYNLAQDLLEAIKRSVVMESSLHIKVFRNLGLIQLGLLDPRELVVEDHGLVSKKVVTDTGVGYIVDAFQNLTELENMKFHGLGTGVTAEAASQSALVTELTTEYNPNSTRATGTTAENAANIFETVATNTLDSGTPAVTEHSAFSATSAGVMLDRSLFSAINLVGANGDSLQTTYRLTFTSGG